MVDVTNVFHKGTLLQQRHNWDSMNASQNNIIYNVLHYYIFFPMLLN